MSKIKAIIFDFDGVLVESMDIKARGFTFLFREYPDKVNRIVQFHRCHGGMSRFEKFKRIYSEILHQPLSNRNKYELGKKFSNYVYNEVVKCPFVKGAKEFLCKYYNKYQLFVVSGTPDNELKSIISDRGLKKYFVSVHGSPQKKYHHNKNILKNFKLDNDEVVFIGDSIDDWKSVIKNKIKFIGRITKNNNPFLGLGVECCIEDLFGLEKMLNRIGKSFSASNDWTSI